MKMPLIMWKPFQRSLPLAAGALSAVLSLAYGVSWGHPVFENLGPPLQPKPVPISVVTPTPDGSFHLAWAAVRSPERKGLLGVDVGTGKTTWIDLGAWDYGRIFLTRAPNGHLYLYTGDPAHFLKLNTETLELTDLSAPASRASYTMAGALAPDGRFYTCSFPKTHLVSVDTATDEITNHGALANDARNKYAIQVLASEANIVYVAIGLHHAEVWAFDPASGEKAQILPPFMGKPPDRVRLHPGEDGGVYVELEGRPFRCLPNGVEPVDSLPDARSELESRRVGDW